MEYYGALKACELVYTGQPNISYFKGLPSGVSS